MILNQIHDLDYIMYIFEKYKLKKKFIPSKVFKYTIDTEDTLTSNLIADKKEKIFDYTSSEFF